MGKQGPRQLRRNERFWTRVERTNDCWLWTGNHFVRGGYGAFYDDDQKLKRAHRVAWELANGRPPPSDLVVCHSCDEPRCVRPDHLFIGTQAENMSDMRVKGRGKNPPPERGEHRYNAKLTEADVRSIRVEAATTPHADLATRYGVNKSLISNVYKRRAWAHVV